jgi:hypothetical protein
LVCAATFWAGAALAQSPVMVTIDARAPGVSIPADFVGLSFETSNLLPDKQGRYIFSGENKQLVSVFKTIGIKNLRIGGGTAEDPRYAVPGPADIDQLFAFAKAAEVRVIYTLRLLNGDKEADAAIASYIQQHYGTRLEYFCIGNEPDWRAYHNKDPKITDYPSFLRQWRTFASAIVAAVPGAKFAGPDTGSDYPISNAKDTDYNGTSWTQHFVADEKKSGRLVAALQHDYIGQGSKGVSIQTAVDAMLSANWDTVNYPALYNHVLAPVQTEGLVYRMTECNDYTGGIDGASNAFASALWALDYMHWQAAHRAVGVNFHNKRWIHTDTIYPDRQGIFQIAPKAYGLKAFELGGRGSVEAVKIANPNRINVTAYAVRGDGYLFVTIINKTHGLGAREAEVAILGDGVTPHAEVIFLTAPNGDVTARAGVTLGGASVPNDGPWLGKWTALPPDTTGQCVVKVAAASAAIARMALEK